MVAGIDVCICTYNRVMMLQQCLERLVPQLHDLPVLITVVDNNSTDSTKEYVQSIAASVAQIRYLFEGSQGLSFARNLAWRESQYKWIFYLDDDCIPEAGLIAAAFKSIADHPVADAIGGPIEPAFSESPPDWLPEGFGEFKMPYEKFTIIEKGYIRGGCFLIKRAVLEKLNGFDTTLGVAGQQLRYGEEIELQERMRHEGYRIAYDPDLRVRHHVRLEKISPRWIIRSEYARRRDRMKFAPLSKTEATVNLLRTLGGRIIWTPAHLVKVLLQPDYSFEEAYLDIVRPLAYRFGEFIGVWGSVKGSHQQ